MSVSDVLKSVCASVIAATMLPLAAMPVLAADVVEPSLLDAVEWRLIGPWRGGRVTAVTGVPDEPMLYYMGATGGGVWMTTNAGATWENVSDGYFKVGTIGHIAVAPSDSNVIYVGTGEAPIRGVTTSHGIGVYKSTDAGKTWAHIGLESAGQISRVEVYPTNPDLAYVAVQGAIWGPGEVRGVYRTTDGGATWEKVLYVNPDTGATDLAMDPTNPRILYAAMWHHGRNPWFIKSGGEGGGIYKSVDGGDNWEKLEGGLPGLIGKVGIDVSASNPQRVYAIIEAELDKGGLWRSDDAGKTWKLMNGHRVLWSRAWYYTHLATDPTDENTVWVLNVPLMRSVDGGKTFERVFTPHGDHQDHWINPHDGNIMINGNDGGATVTFDGGKTWSSITNQPTAQFYRVITDDQVPYRIYGGQQDNSTVAILSSTYGGGIGEGDYHAVGGGESAHVAFDPDDPRLVYATTINGTLTEYDQETQVERTIIPYPEVVWGKDSRDLKYRSNWNAPVIVSPHDPSVIYYGTQYLMKSIDRGVTWTEISPDLTRNDPEKQGRNGGPLTPENVGAEFYNTIFYIAASPVEEGTIWVGSDDGLVHLTRDGGGTWNDVSPPHPGEAMINAIEISPHDPGTVYLAVAGYKLNDFRPYIYKTTDYGRSWRRIDEGLPEETFVRVVREDPARRGLLYAGTENGMFVSFNDGADWQSLQLNLPHVPITDLTVRQDHLVAATQGRALWVIDDLFVLRQAAADQGDKTLHVFAPDTTHMIGNTGSAGRFEGKNPSRGVPIYYYLREEREEPLAIEILDSAGDVVRTFHSEETEHDRCIIGNMDPVAPFELEYPKAEQGLNRWGWNMKREDVPCVDDVAVAFFAGFDGPRVILGDYRARVTIGDLQETVSFTVQQDPRLGAGEAEIYEWAARLDEVRGILTAGLVRLSEARTAHDHIARLMSRYPEAEELQSAGAKAIERIDAWEAEINQVLHETGEDEDAWESKLLSQLRFLMDVIDSTGVPVTEGAMQRLSDLEAEWATRERELAEIVATDVAAVNTWERRNDVEHVPLPKF